MTMRCPVLDTSGRDLHGQTAELRAMGPAVQVELPGGVKAWSINSYSVIKSILTDPLVTKSARNHWPAFINGEIPPDWELISWVAMDNMVTAYGKNHVRLRKLVGNAFTARRTEVISPASCELTKSCSTRWASPARRGGRPARAVRLPATGEAGRRPDRHVRGGPGEHRAR